MLLAAKEEISAKAEQLQLRARWGAEERVVELEEEAGTLAGGEEGRVDMMRGEEEERQGRPNTAPPSTPPQGSNLSPPIHPLMTTRQLPTRCPIMVPLYLSLDYIMDHNHRITISRQWPAASPQQTQTPLHYVAANSYCHTDTATQSQARLTDTALYSRIYSSQRRKQPILGLT
jgi:hypothetical protein